MNAKSSGTKSSSEKQQPSTPLLEWSFALIGVLIVVGLIGFNILAGIKNNGSSPDIQIEVLNHIKTSTGFLVKIKAINVGGSSAAGLMLEGVLRDGSKDVEMSQVTFDYVPGHSSTEGGLFFTHDPQRLELKLRALGYQTP